MKRVADLANDLAQPMYVMMAIFGISAVFVLVALVRRMSDLATDWRLGGSWNIDVSHVLILFVALTMLFAAFLGAWRKARG